MTETVFIGLGSNLGEREKFIESALAQIAKLPGTHVKAVSRLTETQPVGPVTEQPMYMNAVAQIETMLAPLSLLDSLLSIEQSLGRVRKERWGPRTIDLDILMYGNQQLDHPRLRVPHPEIQHRPFILDALRELHAL